MAFNFFLTTYIALIDEYRLMVHPIVVVEGRRLFEGTSQLQLKLIEAKTFKSGCVALRYVKS